MLSSQYFCRDCQGLWVIDSLKFACVFIMSIYDKKVSTGQHVGVFFLTQINHSVFTVKSDQNTSLWAKNSIKASRDTNNGPWAEMSVVTMLGAGGSVTARTQWCRESLDWHHYMETLPTPKPQSSLWESKTFGIVFCSGSSFFLFCQSSMWGKKHIFFKRWESMD